MRKISNMSVIIPWKEIKAERMKEPGYAERMEIAKRELDEEIAIYGTIGNSKPILRHRRPIFAQKSLHRARAATNVRARVMA